VAAVLEQSDPALLSRAVPILLLWSLTVCTRAGAFSTTMLLAALLTGVGNCTPWLTLVTRG
jgi:hypothetical protein